MAQVTLENLKVMVSTASDLSSAAREASERDRDYYDGYQWTAAEIAELNRRKQPVITSNRIKRKIDAMIGIEQRGRVDPRALPRTPAHEEGADIATQALVFIDDQTRFDAKRSLVFENQLVEGYGGVEIIAEERRGKMEVVVNRLRWEEIFFDPASREKDFSDASYMGVIKWMSLDKAKATYGAQHEEMLLQTITEAQDGETYEDRPFKTQTFRWGDKKQRRVRVAQMYYLSENTWYLAIFTGGGEIYNDVSPYVDEDGKPCNPMELLSCYVDRENRRYGVVRDMISQQDEVNKRRSKSLHLLNARQTAGVKGAIKSIADMKAQLAQPDGHVEVDIDAIDGAREAGVPAWQILPTNDQIAGHFQLLQEAKSEIDMLGPNASLLGQLTGDQSGRAIMAQQQAGLAELAPVYDSLRDWTLRVYRQMWMRIRQYWTDERWVRVTDEMEAPKFIGLNQVTGMQFDPATGQVVPQVQNAVAEMDVDIIITDAPDVVTLQQEEFEQLARLAERGIPIPPEALIGASAVRNKAKMLEMLNQQRGQAEQAQMAQVQQAAQLEQVKVAADAQLKGAQTQKVQAETAKIAAEVPGAAAESEAKQVSAIRGLYEAQVDPLGMRNTAAG